ncbi:4-nitrophenylphosphatase [Pseudohyphozyma bogoriensis]|nr:4-nitrophenylphosphatase [Pseudohyphozyma bogoriensis]
MAAARLTEPSHFAATPDITVAITYLRSLNKSIAFVTNNPTKSRQQYLDKFHQLGFVGVELEEIFTCGSASALYLRDAILPKLPVGKKGIYVVGQEGLEHELAQVGLTWKGGSDPEDDVLMPFQDFTSITPDPSIGVVLFSFQMHWNYKQLSKAYNYIATNNAELVLTSDDQTVLIPHGVCPGEGAMAAVLYNARKGGVVPIIVGKPHQPLLDVVHTTLNFDPARTVMVGDRLETDVLFGKRGGISTLLVLTGSSILEDLEGLPEDETPDYVAKCFGDILKARPPVV